MPQDKKTRSGLDYLHLIENALVLFLLSSIILFAIVQIGLRNFFDYGIFWGESLLRILVLWLALFGAIVASRQNKQISIDVLSRFIPQKYKNAANKVNFIFAAAVCYSIAYFSFQFVQLEYESATYVFEKVPAWLAESIIPIGFLILAIKYSYRCFYRTD